jgi:hypothetical protein
VIEIIWESYCKRLPHKIFLILIFSLENLSCPPDSCTQLGWNITSNMSTYSNSKFPPSPPLPEVDSILKCPFPHFQSRSESQWRVMHISDYAILAACILQACKHPSMGRMRTRLLDGLPSSGIRSDPTVLCEPPTRIQTTYCKINR